MSSSIKDILTQDQFSKEDLVTLLYANKDESRLIYEKGQQVKKDFVGRKVYFRGLIEYSNYCSKNCYYCGIRAGNSRYARYQMPDEEVLEAAKFALDNNFASIVIQSGERSDSKFVSTIEKLLKEIHELSDGKLHVTLSLGEQSEERPTAVGMKPAHTGTSCALKSRILNSIKNFTRTTITTITMNV